MAALLLLTAGEDTTDCLVFSFATVATCLDRQELQPFLLFGEGGTVWGRGGGTQGVPGVEM